MALFPERIVFKNSTTGTSTLIAEVAPGSISPLVPGELLMYRESDGFRLYSLSISGSVVQVGARIKNENKGSLTVTSFGEGSSSFVLNDNSVTAVNIPDASIPNAKFASPLSVEKGGTGQTTATTAINALLPSQAGNTDKVLATDGTTLSWDSKKIILNEYENIDTVTDPPVNGDCLVWNSTTSNWVPDQDIPASTVPASATDVGRPGQLAFDSNYLYSCVGVNRWKRAPLSTWNYAQIVPLIISSTASTLAPTKVGPPIPEFVGVGAKVFYNIPTSISVPWPAGHLAGDIGIIVIQTVGATGVASPPTPTGWVLIANVLRTDINFQSGTRVYYKYAASSAEPNAVFTFQASSYDVDAQIIVFRNIATTNPIDAVTSLFNTATTPGAKQPLSITTTTSNCVVLYLLHQGGNCTTAGGCMTATPGTLESPLYFDYEWSPSDTGFISGSLQAHAGRKFTPGVASTDLTYASSTFADGNPAYRMTIALKQKPSQANIILPPAKDTAVVAAPPKAGYLDTLFSSVSLRYAMNGANGSTTFTDLSANNYVATVNGGLAMSTAQSKFGGSSALFNGTNSSLQFASPPGNLVTWWGTDITIECWVRCTSFASDQYPGGVFWSPLIYCGGTTSSVNAYWAFGPVAGGSVRFAFQQTSGLYGYFQQTTGGTITLNNWHHIAMTHVAAEKRIRIFTDGNLTGNTTWLGNPTNGPLYIGRSTFVFLNGYVDDFRYTYGVARYTSSFTPPAMELPLK
jgi:hypothetical protein